jgi:hypothetical protein
LAFSKILSLILTLLATNAFASTKDEINHLLSFVSSTQCQYERNGKKHNGREAKAHIQKKYDYYANDIKTTEDFIKYSATKSTMSGKYYQIHCDKMPVMNSQDWLLNELKAFRAKQ